ncbi:protein kinase domain-containing protein [Archangium lansingense]|uniref:Protein kinase n=1 Tax=Archangium lansingense TaxID=2995310 RepID=A0ABT3ZU75_9BACT|nr:protein kinase [Archangium lansinium]MCY1072866.1 protein kinase [Archangium lansinium]
MSREATHESQHGGRPTSGHEASSGASDFEDSFLRELRHSEPLPLLPVPGERLGGPDGRRYKVLEWLGGGGMGQVFRAQDETLRREVALKFLLPRPDFGAEALTEARAVAQLDQENIVRIFDVTEWHGIPGEPGAPFLVMECLEGEPLSALLKRGRLETRRALEIMEGICSGLAHAHERGLIHRDLKPGNVFLTREGTVKLLDFGLSHWMTANAENATSPSTAGTPAYMAPEQWRGESQDARTDVWAAGVVLYEMLTGGWPFTGATWGELRERVTSEEPAPPVRARNPEVPPEVESLLVTALAKEPARRFSSARELRQEVLELRARLAGLGLEVAGTQESQQRRQLVLLSCRLTGLGGLAERMDAEDVGELEAAFQKGCEEVIQRHGGSVNLYVGGEVFACFGCPQVREDDAARAVRAGLQLAHDMPELLQQRLPHLYLSGLGAQVGLHTDWMVLETRILQGEAPRAVSWLSSQAGPGDVLASEATWLQVRGAFETECLGARDFAGLTGAVHMNVHRVVREREVRVRFDRTLVAGGLTPLVGREIELRQLQALWEGAREGHGAFVLLRGEAGIGKSRLLLELRRRVPPETALRLWFQCWSRPYSGALLPVAELPRALLSLSPEGTPQRHLEALEARLGSRGLPEEHVQLLGLLLSLPIPEGAPVHRLMPARRLEKTYAALVELLSSEARQRPVLLAVEDLHQADSSWLEFLGYLFERIESTRLLVVLSARPEFQPSWPSGAGLHRLSLEHLSPEHSAALSRAAAHGTLLPEETVGELVRMTDGIPFFIEEMTRKVLEGGGMASIPVTLHELLLARLDVLSSRQKALAQHGAVVGREFSLSLLAAVTGREAADLQRELGGLVEAGLLQEEREGSAEPEYQFRHALFQEAAYQSLTRAERRRYHQRIAQVLKERFPEVGRARPELLAHHYTEAGESAPAILYWIWAGWLAIQRMALAEGVQDFSRAQELLRGLPEASRLPSQELTVLTALGYSQALLQGFSSPEAARTFAQVWELLRSMDELAPNLGGSLWILFSYHLQRAEFFPGRELAEQVAREGERQRSPELLALGNEMLAIGSSFAGHVRSALEYSGRTMAHAHLSLEQHRALVSRLRGGSPTDSLAYASIIHAVSGRLELARKYGREALELARRLGEPVTVAMELIITWMICRDVQEALEEADEVITLSGARDYWWIQGWAQIIRGWALAELGQPGDCLALVQQVIARFRARGYHGLLGFQGGGTYCLFVLGGIHLKLGRIREGLTVLHEALEQVRATGERILEAELHRLRGELLRADGREREALQDFLRARAVAHAQGARLFELRATVGLGRLLRDMGRPEAARRRLTRLLTGFEEHVDSVDLVEARTLLAQLSGGAAPVVAGVAPPS